VNTLLVLATVVTVLWCYALFVMNVSRTSFTSHEEFIGYIVGSLAVYIGFGFIGYQLAKRKNRHKWPWVLLCMAASPWAIIPLAPLKRRPAREGQSTLAATIKARRNDNDAPRSHPHFHRTPR
jgi:multisubunit Na+/H+ antiporter MnhE subunit